LPYWIGGVCAGAHGGVPHYHKNGSRRICSQPIWRPTVGLEDDAERTAAMQAWLENRYAGHAHAFADSAATAIALLEAHLIAPASEAMDSLLFVNAWSVR
jgi:hypothetical protein